MVACFDSIPSVKTLTCSLCGTSYKDGERHGCAKRDDTDKTWVKVPSSLESIIANSEERVLQRLYDILIESLMVNFDNLPGITAAFDKFNAQRQRFDWAKRLVLDNEQR